MRKRLIEIAILFCLSTCIGCGKENEAPIEPTEIVEEVSVVKDSSIPNIIELSKTDILAMTAEEVKASVEEYLPNYRITYKIDADREMSDEDWLQLRDIICIQLYGSLSDGIPSEVEADFSDDPNAIYYAPTVEAIEEMDLNSFAIYLNNMYTYYYGEDWLKENNLDFTTVDEQMLLEQKQELIKTLSGAEQTTSEPQTSTPENTEGGTSTDDTETTTDN